MVDVSKVEGPSGSPESFGKKEKGSVEGDKFKDAMRKRVTEVSQIDPDEQKKRKRREEAEGEEEPAEGTNTAPATPPSQVTPFSLENEEKKVSPLAMQGPGISPTESAQKVSMTSPSSEEMADDSGMLEEEAFTESPVSEGGMMERPVSQPPLVPQPPVSEGMTPPTRQPSAAAPPESGQQETGQRVPPPVGPFPEKKPAAAGIPPGMGRTKEPKQASPLPEKKGTTGAELEQASPAKARDTSGFFEQLGREGGEKEGKKPAKTPEELAQEAALQGASPAQPPPLAPGPEGEKKEKPVEEAGLGATSGLPGELPGIAVPPATPEGLPSYANIHPQVMELFDRMVGVMTVMSMSGITETVITLNAPQFASSVFFGSQIIIQEYSTAPQAYNIQLIGTPQAVALFQGNAEDLMAAFQAGNYNFRVNRLETAHLTDRPLFKRKEKAGGEKDAGGGTQ